GTTITLRGRVLIPWKTRFGHEMVQLYRHGRRVIFLVHRAVLQAFRGECPENMECRHRDGNPANDAPANLVWDTRQGNGDGTAIHGTRAGGERIGGARNGQAKLAEAAVIDIRAARAVGDRRGPLAKRFGVNETTISDICLRKTWRHVP